MTEVTIKVEGMSCMHCVGRVKKAVEALAGVQALEVQIGTVKATYDESKIKREDIEGAIVKAGYRAAA